MAGTHRLAVTCLTCGSRLKVIDPRWIGSIAQCPKCGGLVEIQAASAASQPTADQPTRSVAGETTPPQSDQRRLHLGHAEAVDSEALTQSEVVTAVELATDNLTPSATDALTSPRDPELAAENQRGRGPAARGTVSDSTPPRLPASLPADPARAWQSDSSRWVSQLGLVILLAVFGLIGTGIAFAYFVKSYLGKAATVAQTNPTDLPPVSASPDNHEADRTDETPGKGGSGTSGSAEADDQTDPTPRDPNATTSPAGADSEPDSPVETTLTEPVQAPTLPNAANPTPANQAIDTPQAVNGPTQAVNGPTQPETGPPAPPPLAGSESRGDAVTGNTPDGALDALPPGLRRFIPLTDPSTAAVGPPKVFDTPPTIHSIPMDRAAEDKVDDNPLVPKPPSLDIPRALSLRVAIQQRGVPLAELALLVSQLTTVPVELELISLDVAGIPVTQSCPTPAGWMPIGQWLDQTLEPLGLTAELDDDRLLITASLDRLRQAADHALRLDDFGSDAEAVAAWIRPVVGVVLDPAQADFPPADGAADGWNYLAEEKRIDLPAERSAWLRAILAIEAARLARGLPPRLERWRTARWIGSWQQDAQPSRDGEGERSTRITDWPPAAGPPSGPTRDTPRTLSGLLRELSAEHGIAITVAWKDSLRHQITPGNLVMPLMDGIAVGEILDDVVGEAGLQARDAGGSVWWVGSDANYDRYEVITWLSVTPDRAPLVMTRLAASLGLPDRSALHAGTEGSLLLIRVPRFVARQLYRFESSSATDQTAFSAGPQ